MNSNDAVIHQPQPQPRCQQPAIEFIEPAAEADAIRMLDLKIDITHEQEHEQYAPLNSMTQSNRNHHFRFHSFYKQ